MSHITAIAMNHSGVTGGKSMLLGQNGHGTWKYEPDIVHKPSDIHTSTSSSGPVLTPVKYTGTTHCVSRWSPTMSFSHTPGRTKIMGGVQWRF